MRGRPKKDNWPQQWHGPGGESASFDDPQYIPLGWTPYPQILIKPVEKTNKALPTRDELKVLLKEKGIKVDPRWSSVKMEQLLKE